MNGAKETIYEAVGGYGGLLRLASAWHTRVLADEVVSHAISHGYHPQHTERLAAYWAEALGGPTMYSDAYGDETSVVRMHSGNGPHEEMDRRAIACFDQALEDAGLARHERLRRALQDYFAWATTTSLARYPDSAEEVAAGLPIPKWSWDGLVGSEPGMKESAHPSRMCAGEAVFSPNITKHRLLVVERILVQSADFGEVEEPSGASAAY